MKFTQTEVNRAASASGFAAAQCGKAVPFRKALIFFSGRLRLSQLNGGIASPNGREALGEAKPHRTVRGQSLVAARRQALKRWQCFFAAGLLFIICQLACGQPVSSPVAQTPTITTQANDRYRIGPGDVLDITILNRPHLSREATRVEGNGMIPM